MCVPYLQVVTIYDSDLLNYPLPFALNLLLGEDEDAHYALQRLLLKVIGVQAVVLLLYLVMVAIAPYPDYSRSLQRIFAGDIAPLSWLGILIVGMGLPVKFIKDGKAAKMALASFICVLAGDRKSVV